MGKDRDSDGSFERKTEKLKPLESLWIDVIKIFGASEILGSFFLGDLQNPVQLRERTRPQLVSRMCELVNYQQYGSGFLDW